MSEIRQFNRSELSIAIKEAVAAVTDVGMIMHSNTLIGSVAINGQGRDIDVLVYAIHPNGMVADQVVLDQDWFKGGSAEGATDETWASWKKDIGGYDVNLILTTSNDTATNFLLSTLICKYFQDRFGPLDRAARVAAHRIIMDHVCTINLADHGNERGEM